MTALGRWLARVLPLALPGPAAPPPEAVAPPPPLPSPARPWPAPAPALAPLVAIAALRVLTPDAPALAPALAALAGLVPALAVELTQEFERCEDCRRDGLIYPYRDSGGVPTIGFGNTMWESGQPVRMSDLPITRARADALFGYWIAVFAAKVRDGLPADTPERDLAVFVSLAWNIGTGAFASSTVRKRYLAGNRTGALAGLGSWIRDGGKVIRGLQVRRRAELLIAGGMDVLAARAAGEAAYPVTRR